MGSTSRHDFLIGLVNRYLTVFERKRHRDKFLALGLKLLSALLSAGIVVELGITFPGKSESIAKNVALIFSAVAAVLNTWDAFFNHRVLWVRHTVAANRLRCLKDEIEYYVATGAGAITDSDADRIFKRFQEIIVDTNQSWEDLRKEESPGAKATEPTGTSTPAL